MARNKGLLILLSAPAQEDTNTLQELTLLRCLSSCRLHRHTCLLWSNTPSSKHLAPSESSSVPLTRNFIWCQHRLQMHLCPALGLEEKMHQFMIYGSQVRIMRVLLRTRNWRCRRENCLSCCMEGRSRLSAPRLALRPLPGAVLGVEGMRLTCRGRRCQSNGSPIGSSDSCPWTTELHVRAKSA